MVIGPGELGLRQRVMTFAAGCRVLAKILTGRAEHLELPIPDFELVWILVIPAGTTLHHHDGLQLVGIRLPSWLSMISPSASALAV